MNSSLREEKLKKLQRYCKWFTYIPFVDFVLAAGSLAFGNVREKSDLDVIVGARKGRIFTVRLISMLTFNILSVLGIRKRKLSHTGDMNDRICLNHFVTEPRYCLAPPYNVYWRQLYVNLIPIYGSQKIIEQFFSANEVWMHMTPELNETFWTGKRKKILRRIVEFALRGSIGDIIEHAAKLLQIWRIRRSEQERIAQGASNARVRYDDEELEFHPDTRRIESEDWSVFIGK